MALASFLMQSARKPKTLLRLLFLGFVLVGAAGSVAGKALKPVYAHNGMSFELGYPAMLQNGKPNIPTIDGVYNMTLQKAIDANGKSIYVDEWIDSARINLFDNHTGYAYLMLKYNGTHLFFLFDDLTDLTAKGSTHYSDLAYFLFDRNHSGGCLTKDDYQISMKTDKPFKTQLWIGREEGVCYGWKFYWENPPGITFNTTIGITPNRMWNGSIVPHKIVEGVMDMKYVIDPKNENGVIGFDAAVRDGGDGGYILSNTYGNNPNEYADLTFVKHPIPEFGNEALVAATAVTASLYLLGRKNRYDQRDDGSEEILTLLHT